MRVVVMGPNLPDTGEDFHVHAAGCADTRKLFYSGCRDDADYVFEVKTYRALVEEIFADFIFANDQEPWETYADAMRVFPCVGNLP